MSTRAQELVLLPSLKVVKTNGGSIILTQKYLNGVEEFAKSWPGPVTSLMAQRSSLTTDMDHVEVALGGAGTSIEMRPPNFSDLRERVRGSAIVFAFLSPFEWPVSTIAREFNLPIVYTTEYTARTEKQIIDSNTSNPILRIRRKLWVDWAERRRLKMLRTAAGVQCSGSPTYNSYKSKSRNPLLFFDNRVKRQDILEEPMLEEKLKYLEKNKPLRLVFGGRLIEMKGVMELVQVAKHLSEQNISFNLEIYGNGPLEPSLRKAIQDGGLNDCVQLCGVRDFESEWIPLLKSQADVFVCCHTQGDPSSTYPEVMSCGVPIAGYNNEAFSGIVENSGAGWLAEMYQPKKLADIIVRLAKDRSEIVNHARMSRTFAEKHAFENTFAARARHLHRIAFGNT